MESCFQYVLMYKSDAFDEYEWIDVDVVDAADVDHQIYGRKVLYPRTYSEAVYLYGNLWEYDMPLVCLASRRGMQSLHKWIDQVYSQFIVSESSIILQSWHRKILQKNKFEMLLSL